MNPRPVLAAVERLPLLGNLARRLRSSSLFFTGSKDYWRRRYRSGGTSGNGSLDELAQFKADVLNVFVVRHRVRSVIEFGCGDGNQLRRAHYPNYLGFDVSEAAVDRCRLLFRDEPGMRFRMVDAYAGEMADLALSLDVIYHLVEDEVFEGYMARMLDAARRFVIIYSSNTNATSVINPHIRHRRFTEWVRANRAEWQLDRQIKNRHPISRYGFRGSFCDFYIYRRAAAASDTSAIC